MATQEQISVRNWMQKMQQATPPTPTIPSLEIRKLRAKLILEEALETIEALGFIVEITSIHSMQIHSNAIAFYEIDVPNLIDIIDGCEDLKVVTEGTLVACGCIKEDKEKIGIAGHNEEYSYIDYSGDPFFDEVMRANNEKLWTLKEVMDVYGHQTMKFGKGGIPLGNGCFQSTKVGEDQYLVKDSSGKVLKPPSFTPPNHAQFLSAEKHLVEDFENMKFKELVCDTCGHDNMNSYFAKNIGDTCRQFGCFGNMKFKEEK